MKVAIAATERHQDSRIHHTFGKSPYFIVFDSTTGEMPAIESPLQTAGVSTGVDVARFFVDQNIDKVVAGMFGERVQGVFAEAGVQRELVRDKTLNDYVTLLRPPSARMISVPSSSTQTKHSSLRTTRIERGSCYCASCGYSTAAESEVPCFQRRCPNCRTQLERKY